MLHGVVIATNTDGEVAITRIDVARATQRPGRRSNDQRRTALADLTPAAAEIERRTRQLAQTEDAAVKRFGPSEIGHADADVMKRVDGHHTDLTCVGKA